MHAKNLSMRMEELFRKEQQLMEEKASYTTLLSLKEETEWLLSRWKSGSRKVVLRTWNMWRPSWTPRAKPCGWCWTSGSDLT